MKILCCGARNLKDEAGVFTALDQIHAWTVQQSETAMGIVFAFEWERRPGITCLVTGAASGADYLAEKWAKTREIAYRGHHAPWHGHDERWCKCAPLRAPAYVGRFPIVCKAAGPWRNGEMIRREHVGSFPVGLVIAFPGGAGTAGMVRLAEDAGIPVYRVSL